MAIQRLTFYQNNNQIVTVSGLQDQSTLPVVTYIDNAVLTGTLQDSSGNPQVGATGIVGIYVASSNGVYTFSLAGSSFDPPVGYSYVFVIDGTFAAGAKRFHCEIPSIVLVRNQGTEL